MEVWNVGVLLREDTVLSRLHEAVVKLSYPVSGALGRRALKAFVTGQGHAS